MKRILLFLAMALIIVSCAPRLTEKVEAKHSNGQPQVVRYYDKSDKCVKEIDEIIAGKGKPSVTNILSHTETTKHCKPLLKIER